MKRNFKNLIKRNAARIFEVGQKVGLNILPKHFYSQIPDIDQLRDDLFWKAPFEMLGIHGMDLDTQIDFLFEICSKEVVSALDRIHESAILQNGEDGGYGPVEADFLYCFVRKIKPLKIIQIGCGVSTAVILRAAKEAKYTPKIICVEPFPTQFLINLEREGLIELIKEKAQKVAVNKLSDLSFNDFLFVDSTHTVKPAGEVNKIILQILPRLRPDVWVHFHDICFPYDYGRNVLNGDLFFWSESTLLHAFLIENEKFTVKLCQSYLHYMAPDRIKEALQNYIPQGNDDGLRAPGGKHFPSSIYLRVRQPSNQY